jgi:hypothetical protein
MTLDLSQQQESKVPAYKLPINLKNQNAVMSRRNKREAFRAALRAQLK